jgi:hypothetical protein
MCSILASRDRVRSHTPFSARASQADVDPAPIPGHLATMIGRRYRRRIRAKCCRKGTGSACAERGKAILTDLTPQRSSPSESPNQRAGPDREDQPLRTSDRARRGIADDRSSGAGGNPGLAVTAQRAADASRIPGNKRTQGRAATAVRIYWLAGLVTGDYSNLAGRHQPNASRAARLGIGSDAPRPGAARP